MRTAKRAIRRAIYNVGSPATVAKKLRPKITHQAVYHWLKTGVLPKRYAAQLSAMSGISQHELCPEHFTADGPRQFDRRALPPLVDPLTDLSSAGETPAGEPARESHAIASV